MQMSAQGVKESMVQLEFSCQNQLVPDDLAFLKDALVHLGERAHLLHQIGAKLAGSIRLEKVEQEALFYNGKRV